MKTTVNELIAQLQKVAITHGKAEVITPYGKISEVLAMESIKEQVILL